MVGGMKHSSGSVWIGKPHTHAPSDYSVASLESQNQQKHIQSHSHFTPSHTHLRKRPTTLEICGFVLSVLVVKQDNISLCNANNNLHVIVKRLTFRFLYCILSSAGFHTISCAIGYLCQCLWIWFSWLITLNLAWAVSFSSPPTSFPTLLFCSHHRWWVHSFSLLWGCWL